MKIRKDGGPESSVTGYWLCEFKNWFSIVLLKFDGKSREAYHTHAFNSVNWLLWGELSEEFIDGKGRTLKPSIWPIIVRRSDYHKVNSDGVSWVLSFRGPWSRTWKETRADGEHTLTWGRNAALKWKRAWHD